MSVKLSQIENNVPGERKRKRHKTGNEEINDLCWSWFQEAMTRKINVTGPLLKEQALKYIFRFISLTYWRQFCEPVGYYRIVDISLTTHFTEYNIVPIEKRLRPTIWSFKKFLFLSQKQTSGLVPSTEDQ
jgi:hypothetical protein